MHPHGAAPMGMGAGRDHASASVSVSWPSRLSVPVIALCAYLRDKAKGKPGKQDKRARRAARHRRATKRSSK